MIGHTKPTIQDTEHLLALLLLDFIEYVTVKQDGKRDASFLLIWEFTCVFYVSHRVEDKKLLYLSKYHSLFGGYFVIFVSDLAFLT